MTKHSGNPQDASLEPHHKLPRLRRAVGNALLVFGSLLVAALLAEFTVRVFTPQQLVLKRPDIWQPDDGLGWVHHINTRTTVNTGEREVNFVTDSRGFRVGRADRPESTHDILLLGDSFMEALQVEYEQSLAGQLEDRLSHDLGAGVAVHNTAVGDWQPDQYDLQARQFLHATTPDLILVSLYVGNDIISTRREHVSPRVPTQHHPLRLPNRLAMAEIVDAIFYPVNDFLEVHSHLFILLKVRLQTTLMRLRLTEAYLGDVFFRGEATSDRWTITADICRAIAAKGDALDIPTLFVLIPTSYQVDAVVLDKYVRGFGIDTAAIDLEQPNRLLGEALRERNLEFFDALPTLRDAFATGIIPYGRVDRHFSPEGHATVAEAIAPIISAHLNRQTPPDVEAKR